MINLIIGIMEGGVLPTRLSDTLITLVLKVQFPKTISQFKRISLCNTAYKVITKILVNRIRPFLDELMSPFQASFIPKRRAADNVIILREALTKLKQRKGRKGLMIIKLDLEKA